MLEMRPICERCKTNLAEDSTDARICSFECTFCATCADGLLANVCPNCGGGFAPRPIRPAHNWKGDNYLGKYPARVEPKRRAVDAQAHAALVAAIADLPPQQR